MLEIIAVFAVAIALGGPLGHYIARVLRGEPSRLDRAFAPIERAIFGLLGIDAGAGMSWRRYATAFIAANLALGALVFVQLLAQHALPLDPDHAPGMRWDLALHTTVSFLTNTNQQHYSGQSDLGELSQMIAIVGLQVVTPMMGLALAAATLRALFGGRAGERGGDPDVGNFWIDVTRLSLRVLLPLALVWSLVLAHEGVPATLGGSVVATPLDASAGLAAQEIPLGPVAPMVAVKQLGTNGGGWYGPNSAMPLENPTPLSNFVEEIAIVLLPIACVFMIGPLTGRRRLSAFVFGTMLAMSALSVGAAVWSEAHSASSGDAALMEGKETRFGASDSALWAALTTETSNGSVDAMHDSLAPLTGGVAIVDMLVNAIWGGVGCGLSQFLVYMLLAAFLAGLMTGRTPELFGRAIEAHEIRWLALLVVLQPLVVLGLSALMLAVPGWAGTSNPGFHGISQVFYEFASAFSNNGSGFEGLADGTRAWNLTCSVALVLGRYPALIVPLAIAAGMGRKRFAPETAGTLRIESPTFALMLIAVVVILTVLEFLPALALGPIGDHLALAGAAS